MISIKYLGWYAFISKKQKKCCMRIKGNEKADEASKQAIDMPGMTTTRLSHTDHYFLTIMKVRNSEWKKNKKIVLVSYTKLNHS